MSQPIRWGIISTGYISTSFAKDLLVDPATRNVHDVKHKITAVGSRSVEPADKFIEGLKNSEGVHSWGLTSGVLDGVRGYGTYEEVFNDPNVDVVYIGTPHTFHHPNSKAALLAGKHVLCEKPFTFDLEELDELIKIAKEKKLFLMEAVWTRFHPIAYAVQEELFSGKLGKIKRFQADFSMDMKPESHRMLNPDLGGGSLLDMGPYPSVWAMLCMQHHPSNQNRPPKLLSSYQTVLKRTGVDLNSRWLLEWEGVGQGLLLTEMGVKGFGPMTALIQCEEADLAIHWPPYKPESYTIHIHPQNRDSPETQAVTHHVPIHPGIGMHYEADEVARCLVAGKLESDRMPWEESRIVQGWFDEVRKAGETVHKDWKGHAGE
ncbi:hypothetical protein TREMEDRAFT_35632 [Tremella mesenterica DSM 1558]|uniref:uncharacterized protein n=1 Tax=Tremella mesenterica (strain ATCC 24925 / CBS 8224 / DSM 1558 / NBRC 9311 / NRRL Y-6157 / RJB 2259-6 / UBC 559-6) TaxID=578456 RepID=UPI00032CB82C|nr:uncharacterized protein TREMEDRAFT_35632 [Tremella mesenterica DSM 1558]EIW65929.1 hypothetical protein TREMEDRAFT_35632 [Tremella mesenterica DSM 1558]